MKESLMPPINNLVFLGLLSVRNVNLCGGGTRWLLAIVGPTSIVGSFREHFDLFGGGTHWLLAIIGPISIVGSCREHLGPCEEPFTSSGKRCLISPHAIPAFISGVVTCVCIDAEEAHILTRDR